MKVRKTCFGNGSEIDEAVAKDYSKGIGGSDNMLDADHWLAEQCLDKLDFCQAVRVLQVIFLLRRQER